MNALDFGIIIVLGFFFVIRSSRSFVYYLCSSVMFFAGYAGGALLAPSITKNMAADFQKGAVSLGLMLGLALVACLVGIFIGRKLKMKVTLSRLFTLDKLLVWPYKIIVGLLVVVLLSQTLIYIPILSLQFEAQGSTLLRTAGKILPIPALGKLTQNIAPNQFRQLQLDYDPSPLTYNHIAQAGEFQKVVDSVAASVVKVSGRNCVGLGFGSGFVAAPGLVVTNAHVISGASSLYVSDHDGAYPATPIVVDHRYDIAVLYSKFLTTKPLPLASRPAAIGTPAVSLGYPGAGDLQMRQGSVIDRVYKSSHNELNGTNTLTLTASMGPGSSGGPVINLKGEVIGVNDAGAGGELIAIKAQVAADLVAKAKNKLFPASTDFCATSPKFY